MAQSLPLMQPLSSARDLRVALVSWALVLTVSALVLVVTRYRPDDPDSRAYIDIAARLAEEPASRWVAPEWWGAWEREGLFREHPPGIFLAPALVARAGYPAKQSLLLVNGICQALCLVLSALLVARFAPAALAPLTSSLLQLMPIAFVYRIRGNQEYPMLAALLVALYATERARERWPWALAAVAAFVAGGLIKGVFALLFPVICALWLLARRQDGAGAGGWAAVAGMIAAAPLLAAGYEAGYRAATGESFLEYYLTARVSLEAASDTAAGSVARKIYNLAWYSSRLVWYSAPWSLAVLALPWASRARTGGRAWNVRGLYFVLAASLVTVIALSARDTKADRYIFPAYFLLGAAGIMATLVVRPRWVPVAERLAAIPYLPAVLWLVLFLLRVLAGGSLPRFTFWRS
jgi:4-amino-4-deoxy-L-arabinose transferase-like glycosyltransferase